MLFLSVNNICKNNIATHSLENIFDYVDHFFFFRYTWLYYAVFQVKMLNVPAYHTCKEFHRGLKDFHVWSFSATRSHELLQENSNELNGITEETLRYCFEQFARIHIAPHFARIMPGSGLCSNYFSSPPLEHKKESGLYLTRIYLGCLEFPKSKDFYYSLFSENISDPRKSTFVGEVKSEVLF